MKRPPSVEEKRERERERERERKRKKKRKKRKKRRRRRRRRDVTVWTRRYCMDATLLYEGDALRSRVRAGRPAGQCALNDMRTCNGLRCCCCCCCCCIMYGMCLCVSPYFSLSAAPGSLAFVSASIPTYSPSRTRTLAGVDVRAAGGGVVQGSFCVGGGVRAGSLLRFFELMTHAHTEDFFSFFFFSSRWFLCVLCRDESAGIRTALLVEQPSFY